MGIRPHPRLHQGIWDIVAVKLLAAFEAGRRNWVDRVLKLQNTAAPATRGRGGRGGTLGGGSGPETILKKSYSRTLSGLF
jgi:hypothetical protein